MFQIIKNINTTTNHKNKKIIIRRQPLLTVRAEAAESMLFQRENDLMNGFQDQVLGTRIKDAWKRQRDELNQIEEALRRNMWIWVALLTTVSCMVLLFGGIACVFLVQPKF